MQLFPYILTRVAGGKFDNLEFICSKKLMDLLEEIYLLRGKNIEIKSKVCDSLYNLIPSITNSNVQNLLLEFKRDFFNERKIKSENYTKVLLYITEEIRKGVDEHLLNKIKIESLIQKGKEIYDEEIIRTKNELRSLVTDEKFMKGLVLSSHSLLERTVNYLNKPPGQLNKDDLRTEFSLLKYLTRMYTKTSPFSTFTNLGLGRVRYDNFQKSPDNEWCSLLNNEDFHRIKSHIRLNNYFFKYLKGLLFKNISISKHFLIRVNPTIRKNEKEYEFLTNFNNIESFQRIEVNPVLDVFFDLTIKNSEGVTITNLVSTIIENEYIDASQDELEAYIYQLIDYGFLEFNIGVSGIDPDWDLKLFKKLEPLAHHSYLIGEVTATLKELRKCAGEYEVSNVEKRKQIIVKGFKMFKNLCMKLHESAGLPEEERMSPEELRQRKDSGKVDKKDDESDVKDQKIENEIFQNKFSTFFNFKPEQIFLEDTTVESLFEFDGQIIYKMILPYQRLLKELMNFEWNLEENEKMAHYFENKYNGCSAIPLLKFYEDYFREFKKPEADNLERKKNLKQNKKDETGNLENMPEKESSEEEILFNIHNTKKRSEVNNKVLEDFYTLLKNRWEGKSNKVTFSLEDVKDAVKKNYDITNSEQMYNVSNGLFFQVFNEYDQEKDCKKLMFVLNTSLAGYGKFFSRFLHLFDEELTQEVRKWNFAYEDNTLLAEACDESHFNANLHPPLMPFEIWLPNSQNSLPGDKQIPVTELAVRFDPAEKKLKLLHQKLNKGVYIFNLGFQGDMGRSQLFRLLSLFTLNKNLYSYPLVNLINQKRNEENSKTVEKQLQNILLKPRIVFEDKLVLQRKTWLVPKSKLPLRKPDESDWSYFLRINEWRIDIGIPIEIFIFVNDRMIYNENLDPDSFSKLSRDDYKPQYISFRSSILIDMFGKLLAKVPNVLRIEEMLPNSEHLLEIASHKYVVEYFVQWYEYSKGENNQ